MLYDVVTCIRCVHHHHNCTRLKSADRRGERTSKKNRLNFAFLGRKSNKNLPKKLLLRPYLSSSSRGERAHSCSLDADGFEIGERDNGFRGGAARGGGGARSPDEKHPRHPSLGGCGTRRQQLQNLEEGGCRRLRPAVHVGGCWTRASSRLGGHQRRRGGAVAAKAGGANVDDKDDVVGEEPVVGQSKSLGFDFNKEMQADMERLAADSPLAKVGALYSC